MNFTEITLAIGALCGGVQRPLYSGTPYFRAGGPLRWVHLGAHYVQ